MSDEDPRVNASIIRCNEAEARHHDSDATYNEHLVQEKKIVLEREKAKDAFDNSQDYRNGVVTFHTDVTDETIAVLSQTLRRLSRLRPGQPITLYINSSGGSVIDGFQAIDDVLELRRNGIEVNIVVRGQAASMAAVLLQAGTKRIVGRHAFIMLHRASFAVQGDAARVEDAVEETRMLENCVYGLLAERTGKTVSYWRNRLSKRKDVWLSAEEAVACGLADEVG